METAQLTNLRSETGMRSSIFWSGGIPAYNLGNSILVKRIIIAGNAWWKLQPPLIEMKRICSPYAAKYEKAFWAIHCIVRSVVKPVENGLAHGVRYLDENGPILPVLRSHTRP